MISKDIESMLLVVIAIALIKIISKALKGAFKLCLSL